MASIEKLALIEKLKDLVAEGLTYGDCTNFFGSRPTENPFVSALYVAAAGYAAGSMDDKPVVSAVPGNIFKEDEGAYVSLWEWVTNEAAGIPYSFESAISQVIDLLDESGIPFEGGDTPSVKRDMTRILWLNNLVNTLIDLDKTSCIQQMLERDIVDNGLNPSNTESSGLRGTQIHLQNGADVISFQPVNACESIVDRLKGIRSKQIHNVGDWPNPGNPATDIIKRSTALISYFQEVVKFKNNEFNALFSGLHHGMLDWQDADDDQLFADLKRLASGSDDDTEAGSSMTL